MVVKEIEVIVVGLVALNRKGKRSSYHQAFALKCKLSKDFPDEVYI